jgi:CBS domain-containing protein
MSQPTWVPVRDVMRKEVTFITGRTDVLEAMRIMKRVKATVLMVEKRDCLFEFEWVFMVDFRNNFNKWCCVVSSIFTR